MWNGLMWPPNSDASSTIAHVSAARKQRRSLTVLASSKSSTRPKKTPRRTFPVSRAHAAGSRGESSVPPSSSATTTWTSTGPNVGHTVEARYGGSPFRADPEKFRFYSRTHKTKRCEVERHRDGVMYDAFFRAAGCERRQRKHLVEHAPARPTNGDHAMVVQKTPEEDSRGTRTRKTNERGPRHGHSKNTSSK